MILCCRVSKDFSIEDDKGKKLTIDEAKQLVADDKIEDCNIGFQRLVNYDWDIEQLKQFYIDNP